MGSLAALGSLAGALATSACSGGASVAAGPRLTQVAGVAFQPRAFPPACTGGAAPGSARCGVAFGSGAGFDTAQGYGPSDLQSAYRLPSATGGIGQTVAVVDAYDDPNAESDLAVYRASFALAPCASPSGCLTKVNQRGVQGSYPPANAGWAAEMSVDLDMVSAGCPNCRILLVEADSNSGEDLGRSVAEAIALGARVVGNSYGGNLGKAAEKWYLHHDAIVVGATGELDSKPQEPAAYPGVVAVGGTTLTRSRAPRGWSESAWSAGGCSPFPKPAWQHDSFCTTRTTNDVAAVADPSTGVTAYDTYGAPGFFVAGGTSVAASLVASMYGLAANAATLFAAQSIYKHHESLYDILPRGFDEPTGWGTPDGVRAL